MCRPAFDALDRDWETLVQSPEAAAALRRWSSAPELAATDLDTLAAAIWRASKSDADGACAQLAGRAPSDKIAARVLLQVLRPGLRNLGRRLALGGSFEDVDQELLSLAWERIHTYRVDRRPTAIAANILLDVRKAYIRGVVEPTAKCVSLDGLPAARWPVAPSAEHEAVDSDLPSLRRAHARLAEAVDAGAITAVSAGVVWRTRVQELDDADVAASWASGSAHFSVADNAPSESSPKPADESQSGRRPPHGLRRTPAQQGRHVHPVVGGLVMRCPGPSAPRSNGQTRTALVQACGGTTLSRGSCSG